MRCDLREKARALREKGREGGKEKGREGGKEKGREGETLAGCRE